ncbi:MAG: phosphopantetheine-binding protein [Deferribacteraceae bacterium]|jgi:acyl carrier protein|nr:phosphopantetheine-binding protein [Deferribacteraceae bacterium]
MQYNKEAIFNKISDILENDFDCSRDKLTPDANIITDLDLDSIDAIDLVIKLQNLTEINVKPEDFKQIRTLQDIADVVFNLVNSEYN